MSIESKLSGHWTDDQLIEYLYGVGPDGAHLETCAECQERLSAAQAKRQWIEASQEETVTHEFLMAQRRRIYTRLSRPSKWWESVPAGRWVSAAATALVLAGGFVVYDQKFRENVSERHLSDVELAQDVSRMANDSEPCSTHPLRALFE